jgi:hypothetical protein
MRIDRSHDSAHGRVHLRLLADGRVGLALTADALIEVFAGQASEGC